MTETSEEPEAVSIAFSSGAADAVRDVLILSSSCYLIIRKGHTMSVGLYLRGSARAAPAMVNTFVRAVLEWLTRDVSIWAVRAIVDDANAKGEDPL